MFTHLTKIRVRYAETDQMGYMYYGHYAQLYEVGRVEMFRSVGTTYSLMEKSGIILPVLELRSKYIKPALYDEEISIKVILREIPTMRVRFNYELYNESDILINIGETTLVFVDVEKKRPCFPPQDFLDKIKGYFD